MVEYSLIAAVAKNWVIGKDGDIPWNIPEDFKLFREKTTDTVIIMGKKTWLSFPKRPLPNRINIILTSDSEFEAHGAIICKSLDEAFEKAEEFEKEIFVIGGEGVYRAAIDGANYLYISHVKGEFEGDTLFPEFDKDDYDVIEEKEFDDFVFRKYKKRI